MYEYVPNVFVPLQCQEGLVWPDSFQGIVFMDYFPMFFQNFVDLYSVFVIRYYEWEYSPLLFWLGVDRHLVFKSLISVCELLQWEECGVAAER